jgi:hypothetical protein
VKHGDRLRLENYSLLENDLKPLAKRVRTIPALASACAYYFLSHYERGRYNNPVHQRRGRAALRLCAGCPYGPLFT